MTAVITQDVPLVDLRAQYATIRDEVRKAIDEVLESMQLTIGPNVRAFDEEFARYIGAKHAVGVGSGTDALQLAIRADGFLPPVPSGVHFREMRLCRAESILSATDEPSHRRCPTHELCA